MPEPTPDTLKDSNWREEHKTVNSVPEPARDIRHKAVTTTEPWHSNIWSQGEFLDKRKALGSKLHRPCVPQQPTAGFPRSRADSLRATSRLNSRTPSKRLSIASFHAHKKKIKPYETCRAHRDRKTQRDELSRESTTTGRNPRSTPAHPLTPGHNPPVRAQSSDPPPAKTGRPGWYRHTACFLFFSFIFSFFF